MSQFVNNDYIYSEETSVIIGACYEVYNYLGAGLKESTYEKALAKEFELRKLNVKTQILTTISYKDKIVGKRYFDFLVNAKIIIELKVGNYFSKQNFEQIFEYLKISNLKLGLLILFTTKGVRIKRIPNIKDNS